MREAGVYTVENHGGGRWELIQALRWVCLGDMYAHGEWRQTEFRGFGFYGMDPEIVLGDLLRKYAPMHWPGQGEMQCCARVCWE
jgi:hypothetical protein